MNRKRLSNASSPLGLATFTRLRLRAALFLAGASAMALGILSMRMIGPHFGQGIFVWTALVSVSLTALALGYWAGGLLADRRPSLLMYSGVLLSAAAAVVLILVARGFVLEASWKYGLEAGGVLSATCLLFPPMVLLGMVTPAAVRLEARDVDQSGRTTGQLQAIFLAGAVPGGALAGFWLIPSFRLPTVLVIIAATLAAASLLGMGPGIKKRVTGLVLSVVTLGVALSRPGPRPSELIASGSHDGTDVRVISYEGSRYLFVDQAVHTSVNAKGRTLEKYVYFIVSRVLMARPRTASAVLVGLGGAGMVPLLTDRGVDVSCVDSSPAVVEQVRACFGLSLPDTKMHIGDGRVFLKRHPARFDAVILDVSTGDRPASPLVTVEGLRTAGNALTPGGLLALNTWGLDEERGAPNQMGAAVYATLKEVFKHVLAVPASGNLLFFASQEPIQARISSVLLPAFDVPRHFTWLAVPPVDWPEVPALTDDWNPADLLDRASLEEIRRFRWDTFPEPVKRALVWE